MLAGRPPLQSAFGALPALSIIQLALAHSLSDSPATAHRIFSIVSLHHHTYTRTLRSLNSNSHWQFGCAGGASMGFPSESMKVSSSPIHPASAFSSHSSQLPLL